MKSKKGPSAIWDDNKAAQRRVLRENGFGPNLFTLLLAAGLIVAVLIFIAQKGG